MNGHERADESANQPEKAGTPVTPSDDEQQASDERDRYDNPTVVPAICA